MNSSVLSQPQILPASVDSSIRHNHQQQPGGTASVMRYEDSEEYDVADGHSSDDMIVYENSVTIDEVRRVFSIGKVSGQGGDEFGGRAEGAAG